LTLLSFFVDPRSLGVEGPVSIGVLVYPQLLLLSTQGLLGSLKEFDGVESVEPRYELLESASLVEAVGLGAGDEQIDLGLLPLFFWLELGLVL